MKKELLYANLNNRFITVWARGIPDRLYSNHLIETKFTAKPDNYSKVFQLSPQVGLYFLLYPETSYCIMEIVKRPSQRYTEGEEPEAFQDRIYDAVMSRPSEYFKGYNHRKRVFGKPFYRSEFDLKEVVNTLYQIDCERKYRIGSPDPVFAFYQEHTGCFAYNSPCEYMPICETGEKGGISETLFTIEKQYPDEGSNS